MLFTVDVWSRSQPRSTCCISIPSYVSSFIYLYICFSVHFLPTFFMALTYKRTRLVLTVAAAAKSLQSCPTLCDPTDGSPPGSPVPGILQARTLEWVAISFSNAWKWKVKVKLLSHVLLLATPWTAAYQSPPSVGFSRWEYWSGVPLPSPSLLLLTPKNKTTTKHIPVSPSSYHFFISSNLV